MKHSCDKTLYMSKMHFFLFKLYLNLKKMDEKKYIYHLDIYTVESINI